MDKRGIDGRGDRDKRASVSLLTPSPPPPRPPFSQDNGSIHAKVHSWQGRGKGQDKGGELPGERDAGGRTALVRGDEGKFQEGWRREGAQREGSGKFGKEDHPFCLLFLLFPTEHAHGPPWHSRIISSGSSHFLCLGTSPTNTLSSWEWGMEGIISLPLSLECFPGPCPRQPKVLLQSIIICGC